jgi:hypothetical protein
MAEHTFVVSHSSPLSYAPTTIGTAPPAKAAVSLDGGVPFRSRASHEQSPSNKKTDMVEHPQVFDHAGLLFNAPPGLAELRLI